LAQRLSGAVAQRYYVHFFACPKYPCSFAFGELAEVTLSFMSLLSVHSVLLLAQKKRTKEKGSHKSFLGLSFFRLPTHYNSFALLSQTVMLTYILPFATSKMLISFQKRFEGFARLTAIRVTNPPKVLSLLK
jgi:hypothetical protein